MIPDELALAAPDAARLADELLRAGRPFHAHEVLEASWKSAPPHERDLWQGLAQVAVGLTHAQRGNARGAVALLRRGADRVRGYQGTAESPAEGGRPYGIDIAAVLAACDDLAARIERRGLAEIPAAELRPKLLAPNVGPGRS
jgi:predicted metal-dependent hydrolase